MTDQPPFHIVTNRDIWDKLLSIEESVNTAAGKVERHDEKITDNSSKIRSLEIKVYGLIAGLVAAIGILIWGGTGV